MESAQPMQPAQAGGTKANVKYGVYTQPGNFANQAVSQVRSQLTSLWAIPKDASAYKGKEKLDENYVIQPGDHIEFLRRSGEKG